jgi:hypothetical protein
MPRRWPIMGDSSTFRSLWSCPLSRLSWRLDHRYLMTRLSLQVIYLWRHVSSTAPPFILWWPNLEILFGPLHRSSPFIGKLRCQAIQMEHGPYIAERTQKAGYIVRCLWVRYCSNQGNSIVKSLVRVIGCLWIMCAIIKVRFCPEKIQIFFTH